MCRVTDNHICIRNLLHHPVSCTASLEISLCLLVFFFQFLFGHPDLFLVIPSLVKIIKPCDCSKDQADFYDHRHHHLQCIHRGCQNVHIHHSGNIQHIFFQNLIQNNTQNCNFHNSLQKLNQIFQGKHIFDSLQNTQVTQLEGC